MQKTRRGYDSSAGSLRSSRRVALKNALTCTTMSHMYRVFETLDELMKTTEGAMAVPLTSNCVVPRNDFLALLDELRNALPEELDSAQDVLDRADSILSEAHDEADRMVSEAKDQAQRTLDDAHHNADEAVRKAQAEAKETVNRAHANAERTERDAQERADAVLSSVTAKAQRLDDEARSRYEKLIEDGQREQERLISEAEVVRRAEEEAHRVVDSAHSESQRLRMECDEYVDDTLGQFETTLRDVMRIVERDRGALRRGAGVSGAPVSRTGSLREEGRPSSARESRDYR